jgi:hypothetical protein
MADVTATFAARDESFNSTVTQLQNRLNSFQGGLQGFNNEVANIGATFTKIGIAVGAVVGVFRSVQAALSSFQQTLENTDALNDFANRVNALPGDLALLQTAFQNAGSSADALEPAINRLNNELGKASQGSAEAQEKFSRLGLNFELLKTQSPTEQLLAVGNAIKELPTPADQTAAAIAFFGRSGASLVNVLTQLQPELANARGQLGSYPEILNSSAAAMGRLNDNIVQVQDKVNQFTTGALAALEPLLSNIAEAAARVDFAGMGQNLGQTLTSTIDAWVGMLSMKGPEIAQLLLGNMQDSIAIVADFLADKLAQAFSFAGTYFAQIFQSGAINSAMDYLANALVNAVAQFDLAMLNMLQNTIAPAITSLLSMSASDAQNLFSRAFSAVLNALASDFVQFLSNPVAFVASSFASALSSAATSTAREFQTGYNASFGNVIEGLRGGLLPVIATTKSNMDAASDKFQSKVTSAANVAAEKSGQVDTDFFNSAEAAARIEQRIANAQQSGAGLRADMQNAADAINGIPLDLNTSAQDAGKLEQSFDEAKTSAEVAQLKTSEIAGDGSAFASSIRDARGNIQASVDLMVGPNGLTDRFNQAMDRVQELKDTIGSLQIVNEDDAYMRKAERGMDSAARRYDRAQDNINDLQRRGQWSAADNARQRAQESFERTQRQIEYEQHSEELRARDYQMAEEKDFLGERLDAQRQADADHEQRMNEMNDRLNQEDQATADRIREGQLNAAEDFFGKTQEAADAVKQGGQQAADALKNAVQGLTNQGQQALALEATLLRCEVFLKNIDNKLPQHALS